MLIYSNCEAEDTYGFKLNLQITSQDQPMQQYKDNENSHLSAGS